MVLLFVAPLLALLYQASASFERLKSETTNVLNTFAGVIDERDPSTARHSRRVADYVGRLAGGDPAGRARDRAAGGGRPLPRPGQGRRRRLDAFEVGPAERVGAARDSSPSEALGAAPDAVSFCPRDGALRRASPRAVRRQRVLLRVAAKHPGRSPRADRGRQLRRDDLGACLPSGTHQLRGGAGAARQGRGAVPSAGRQRVCGNDRGRGSASARWAVISSRRCAPSSHTR